MVPLRRRDPGAREIMASPKIQRWVDLLAELLSRRFPVTLAELERQIPGYGGGKEKAALRRMFERDKDELRSFGVPIETVETDEGEIGYRLRTRDFYLPYLALRGDSAPKPRKVDAYGYKALAELAFEPEELEAVAAGATRVRQLGDPILAEHAESALRKLACDLPLDASAGEDTTVVPGNPVSVEVLEELGVALENRKRAEFDYHSMSSGKTSRRTVEAGPLLPEWSLVPGGDCGRWHRGAELPGEPHQRPRDQPQGAGEGRLRHPGRL